MAPKFWRYQKKSKKREIFLLRQKREKVWVLSDENFAHHTRQSVAIIETQKYILFFSRLLLFPAAWCLFKFMNGFLLLYIRDEKNIRTIIVMENDVWYEAVSLCMCWIWRKFSIEIVPFLYIHPLAFYRITLPSSSSFLLVSSRRRRFFLLFFSLIFSLFPSTHECFQIDHCPFFHTLNSLYCLLFSFFFNFSACVCVWAFWCIFAAQESTLNKFIKNYNVNEPIGAIKNI